MTLNQSATVAKRMDICDVSMQQSYTILVVDDSEADRFTYSRYISQIEDMSCCKVVEAEIGEEGLELTRLETPDLILLDYLLPDMDGLEFIEQLQQLSGNTPPVIMLTGEGDEKIAVQAMKMGARDYLVKGELTADRLLQSVRRVLSQQAMQILVTRQQQQQQFIDSVAIRISQAIELDEILQMAAEGVRELLDCDRTVIYRFDSDMSGTILAESVLPGFTVSLGTQIMDTCLQENAERRYLEGHKTIISDIHDSDLTPCHIQMLERFEVRANLVVPIVISNLHNQERKVWGLLLAHHCRSTRDWWETELNLLDALALQFAIAVQQAEYIAMLKSKASDLAIANEQLSKTAQQLTVRNQELDEFARVASHDLRAPLRGISNLVSWLEEDLTDKIPEDNQNQLTLIRSRVSRLDGFISGMLDYSRAGRQNLPVEAVDILALVDEVVDTLSPSSAAFEIAVQTEVPTIQGHSLLLQQVLSNLIGNAIKYHDKEQGRIDVTAVNKGNWLEFTVADDGPGIEPAYHQKVFGIFQTLNSRDDVESTGIGLSVVKKLVENQQGTVTLHSALGEGSRFVFTWPKGV